MIKKILLLLLPLSLLCFGVFNYFKEKDILNDSFFENQKNEITYRYKTAVSSRSEKLIHVSFNEKILHFDLGSSKLKTESQRKLIPLIEILDSRNKITIIGHTCDIGSDDSNLILSRERAESVMNFIKYKNDKINKFEIYGYGELYPIVDELLNEHRKYNRRVEIIIEDSKPEQSAGLNPEVGDNVEENFHERLNGFSQKYNWLIILIGLIGTIIVSYDIIRKR